MSNTLVPIPNSPQQNRLPSRVFDTLLIVLVAIGGTSLCAEEVSELAEHRNPAKEIIVHPNGYFELSAERYLNEELITYGDLIKFIYEIAEEKLDSLQDKKKSQLGAAHTNGEDSNVEPSPIRTERTWKRRMLVLLDGERVTGTADRNMKIEEHLGTSFDTIKSLEGILSTDVVPIQISYPRVLNFVTIPPAVQESDSTPDKSDS